jgi:hypothetical protein
VTTIIICAGTVYRGMKYQHDTERDVPDEVAQRMLREGTARPVPMRETDRADAAALAQGFRQMHQAAVTINEVLQRNDRLNGSVPSAAEFAAACHAMVAHYEALAG